MHDQENEQEERKSMMSTPLTIAHDKRGSPTLKPMAMQSMTKHAMGPEDDRGARDIFKTNENAVHLKSFGGLYCSLKMINRLPGQYIAEKGTGRIEARMGYPSLAHNSIPRDERAN